MRARLEGTQAASRRVSADPQQTRQPNDVCTYTFTHSQTRIHTSPYAFADHADRDKHLSRRQVGKKVEKVEARLGSAGPPGMDGPPSFTHLRPAIPSGRAEPRVALRWPDLPRDAGGSASPSPRPPGREVGAARRAKCRSGVSRWRQKAIAKGTA